MSDSLFKNKNEPLASRLRPLSLDDIIGQKDTVQFLKRLSSPVSLILYGPAGTGKTSIARILGETWNLEFKQINAVSSGVKDIKELHEYAKKQGSILLFIDEIHRFSASQQDSLLEPVEKGEIILIASTSENPAFRLNRPLLSRCNIYKLEPLTKEDLLKILVKGCKELNFDLEESIQNSLVLNSGGDARRLLSLIEIIYKKNITKLEDLENFLNYQSFHYDKDKESHYDYISAFIKSIRGSDPDAAIFYLACMLEGGEDPLFIIRRLIILASEDIGNASVHALPLAVSVLHSFERIGMPEGRILISQLVCFLASAPKSNSSYLALDTAISFIKKEGRRFTIPNHLRNAPTFLHKKEGASTNYKYPHDYDHHFVEENYFPVELQKSPPQFYFPSEEGFDKQLKERLKSLWKTKKKYT
jgi:putative ATPase